MKRTPLTRKASLNPGTKGLRQTGISRTSPLKRGTGKPRSTLPCPSPAPKAKKPTVSPEEKRARQLVRARSGGVCECCDRRRATDYSHRAGEGVGGAYCPANAMDSCRPCHRWHHSNPTAARDERGWRLESHENPAEMPVLHALHGWVLLDEDGGWVQVDAEDALAVLAA